MVRRMTQNSKFKKDLKQNLRGKRGLVVHSLSWSRFLCLSRLCSLNTFFLNDLNQTLLMLTKLFLFHHTPTCPVYCNSQKIICTNTFSLCAANSLLWTETVGRICSAGELQEPFCTSICRPVGRPSWSEIRDFSPTAQCDLQIQKVSLGGAASKQLLNCGCRG